MTRLHRAAWAGDCMCQLNPILPTCMTFVICSINTSIYLACLIPWPPPSSLQKRKLEYPSAVPKGPAFGRCSIPPPLLTDLAPASLVTVISFVSLPLCSAALLYCWEAVCSRGSFHSVVLQQAGLKCSDMKKKKTSILFKHWFLLLSTACNKQTYFLCPAPQLFVSLHKTTIIGQCSIDKLWKALINQLDNGVCGSVQIKEVMGEAGPLWVGETDQHPHFISSYMFSVYRCVKNLIPHISCVHHLHTDTLRRNFPFWLKNSPAALRLNAVTLGFSVNLIMWSTQDQMLLSDTTQIQRRKMGQSCSVMQYMGDTALWNLEFSKFKFKAVYYQQ